LACVCNVADLDRWIGNQTEKPTRPEAIRVLLKLALTSETVPAAQKASELAARVAERIVDKSMHPEERQRRKRALIKGPEEFRDLRQDLPKSKS
jgi:hypothetical protein